MSAILLSLFNKFKGAIAVTVGIIGGLLAAFLVGKSRQRNEQMEQKVHEANEKAIKEIHRKNEENAAIKGKLENALETHNENSKLSDTAVADKLFDKYSRD